MTIQFNESSSNSRMTYYYYTSLVNPLSHFQVNYNALRSSFLELFIPSSLVDDHCSIRKDNKHHIMKILSFAYH